MAGVCSSWQLVRGEIGRPILRPKHADRHLTAFDRLALMEHEPRASRWTKPERNRMSLGERLEEMAHKIDRKVGWHRLPLPLSIPVLRFMRDRLREKNLFDTGQPSGLKLPETNGDSEPAYLTPRTWDGTYNDLADPLMGSTGTRFGRNVPLEHTFPEEEPRFST